MPEYQHTLSIDFDKLRQVAGDLVNHSDVCGDGDFILIGAHFASLLKDKIGVNRKTRILDVGCSIGRLAVPLTQMVDQYDGFDVVAESIDRATQTISNQYPSFRFKHVDVYNFAYNKTGKNPIEEFQFPYANSQFDIVVLVSVFTHMMPLDISIYLKEISRVLKPGGKSLITYFLEDEVTKSGKMDRQFSPTSDPQLVNLDWLKIESEKNHMQIEEVLHGWWSQAPEPTSYQDIVFSKKVK